MHKAPLCLVINVVVVFYVIGSTRIYSHWIHWILVAFLTGVWLVSEFIIKKSVSEKERAISR